MCEISTFRERLCVRYALGGLRHHAREFVWGENGSYDPSDAAQLEALVRAARQAAGGEWVCRESTTHAGFGVACSATSFRYVEVAVTAVVDLDEVACPDELMTPELTLSGSMLAGSNKLGPLGVSVFYDAPPRALAAPQLRSAEFKGAYDDRSDERTLVAMPWDFTRVPAFFFKKFIGHSDEKEIWSIDEKRRGGSKREETFFYLNARRFSAGDGAFSARLSVAGASGVLRAGSYYVQLHVRGDVATIPYLEENPDSAVPVDVAGGGSVVATGLVLRVGDQFASAAVQSIDGESLAVVAEDAHLTLEERAARHDANAHCATQDGAPLCKIEVLLGAGSLNAHSEDFEKALYMPVERCEQLTTANLGA